MFGRACLDESGDPGVRAAFCVQAFVLKTSKQLAPYFVRFSPFLAEKHKRSDIHSTLARLKFCLELRMRGHRLGRPLRARLTFSLTSHLFSRCCLSDLLSNFLHIGTSSNLVNQPFEPVLGRRFCWQDRRFFYLGGRGRLESRGPRGAGAEARLNLHFQIPVLEYLPFADDFLIGQTEDFLWLVTAAMFFGNFADQLFAVLELNYGGEV